MRIVHIAQGTPDSSQNGSSIWPYRVNDALELDELFRANREPTTFLLAPGRYLTRGNWAFPEYHYASLAPNCRLIGKGGSGGTTLALDEDYEQGDGAQRDQAVETLVGGGYGSEGSSQMEVSGLTIDCSMARDRPSSGVHLYTGGGLIQDVRVLGVKGNWDTLVEGFAILLNDSTGARNGGNTIRNCRVEFDAGALSYYNGIYLGSVQSLGAPNLVENCHCVAIMTEGVKRSHTAFGVNENTTIRNCVGTGFERFVFCDTGNVGDLEVTGCRGDFAYCAIDLPAHVDSIQYRRRIRITNCSFANAYPTTDHAIALLVQDKTQGNRAVPLENIDMDGCRWTTALRGDQFYAISIQGLLTKSVWIRNSVFPAGVKTRDGVYSPTPQSEVRIEIPGGTMGEQAQKQGAVRQDLKPD